MEWRVRPWRRHRSPICFLSPSFISSLYIIRFATHSCIHFPQRFPFISRTVSSIDIPPVDYLQDGIDSIWTTEDKFLWNRWTKFRFWGFCCRFYGPGGRVINNSTYMWRGSVEKVLWANRCPDMIVVQVAISLALADILSGSKNFGPEADLHWMDWGQRP